MKHDPFKDFRALSKDEQREEILIISAMCIDGAPVSLARKIEIYLDVTPDEQRARLNKAFREE